MAGMFEQVIYCRWNLKHRQSKLSYTHIYTLSGCIRVAEYRAHDRSKIGNVLIIAFATVDGTINVCMHVCMSEWFTLCNVSNASVKIGILFIYLAVSSNIREKAKEQTMAEINVRRSVRNYGVNFPFAMYFYDHIIMNGRIVDRVSAVRAWSEQEMSVCVCVWYDAAQCTMYSALVTAILVHHSTKLFITFSNASCIILIGCGNIYIMISGRICGLKTLNYTSLMLWTGRCHKLNYEHDNCFENIWSLDGCSTRDSILRASNKTLWLLYGRFDNLLRQNKHQFSPKENTLI